MNDCDRLLSYLSAAQNFGDFFLIRRGRRAAVGELYLALDERLRKLRAARLAAAAAVGVGEQLFHLFDALVLAHRQKMGTDDEDGAEYDGDGKHDAAGNQYLNQFFHTLTSLRQDARKARERHRHNRRGDQCDGKAFEAFGDIRLVRL